MTDAVNHVNRGPTNGSHSQRTEIAAEIVAVNHVNDVNHASNTSADGLVSGNHRYTVQPIPHRVPALGESLGTYGSQVHMVHTMAWLDRISGKTRRVFVMSINSLGSLLGGRLAGGAEPQGVNLHRKIEMGN